MAGHSAEFWVESSYRRLLLAIGIFFLIVSSPLLVFPIVRFDTWPAIFIALILVLPGLFFVRVAALLKRRPYMECDETRLLIADPFLGKSNVPWNQIARWEKTINEGIYLWRLDTGKKIHVNTKWLTPSDRGAFVKLLPAKT